MKNIIFILLCMAGLSSYAQTFNAKNPPATPSGPTRGTNGTYQPFSTQVGVICAVKQNTVTPVPNGALDTLVNADTGYVQFTFPSKVDLLFDLAVTKISGTIAGTAQLQGSTDNVNWHPILGDTLYALNTVGYQATLTNTTGTAHYQWVVPMGRGIAYPYYQVAVKPTGTSTESYTAGGSYKY